MISRTRLKCVRGFPLLALTARTAKPNPKRPRSVRGFPRHVTWVRKVRFHLHQIQKSLGLARMSWRVRDPQRSAAPATWLKEQMQPQVQTMVQLIGTILTSTLIFVFCGRGLNQQEDGRYANYIFVGGTRGFLL